MPDEFGRRQLKITPPGDSNRIEDVLDELYEVLLRRGYAITQGNQNGQSLIVLCRQPEPGRLEPVAQIAQMIPQGRNKGVDWRAVGADAPKVSVQ